MMEFLGKKTHNFCALRPKWLFSFWRSSKKKVYMLFGSSAGTIVEHSFAQNVSWSFIIFISNNAFIKWRIERFLQTFDTLYKCNIIICCKRCLMIIYFFSSDPFKVASYTGLKCALRWKDDWRRFGGRIVLGKLGKLVLSASAIVPRARTHMIGETVFSRKFLGVFRRLQPCNCPRELDDELAAVRGNNRIAFSPDIRGHRQSRDS